MESDTSNLKDNVSSVNVVYCDETEEVEDFSYNVNADVADTSLLIEDSDVPVNTGLTNQNTIEDIIIEDVVENVVKIPDNEGEDIVFIVDDSGETFNSDSMLDLEYDFMLVDSAEEVCEILQYILFFK